MVIRTTQFRGCEGEECGAGRSVLYIDALGRLLPCTLTDNTAWRGRADGIGIGEAMDMYAREITDLPASSCVELAPARGDLTATGLRRVPPADAARPARRCASTCPRYRSTVTRQMLQVRLRLTARAFGVGSALIAANRSEDGGALEVDAAALARPTARSGPG